MSETTTTQEQKALNAAYVISYLEKVSTEPLDNYFFEIAGSVFSNEQNEEKKKVFLLPAGNKKGIGNDLEAAIGLNLLLKAGYKIGEDIFLTKQDWGASYDNVEPDIVEAINNKENISLYVWELEGKNNNIFKHDCMNLDHHKYNEDDRSNILSSLEQLANVIGKQLTIAEIFGAINDTKYISGMREYAKEIGMDEKEAEELISKVRYMDRFVQGITVEQEKQAEEALKDLVVQENGLYVVNLPHSKCATITDRLYGQYDNILIICGDGEIDFYGKGSICGDLLNQFQGWRNGGDPEASGYWCGNADPAAVLEFVNESLEKVSQLEADNKELTTLDELADSVGAGEPALTQKDGEVELSSFDSIEEDMANDKAENDDQKQGDGEKGDPDIDDQEQDEIR